MMTTFDESFRERWSPDQCILAAEIESLQLPTTTASDALDSHWKLHPSACHPMEMTNDGAPAQSTGQNVMEWQGFPWMQASRGDDRARRSDRRSNRSMRAGGSFAASDSHGSTGTLSSRSSLDSCRDDSSAGQFKVGDLVRARYGKYDEADGVIKVVNRDGTYGVLFQDGRYYGKAVQVTARDAEERPLLGAPAGLPSKLNVEDFVRLREHVSSIKDRCEQATKKHQPHRKLSVCE
jgi:hypothetical protein